MQTFNHFRIDNNQAQEDLLVTELMITCEKGHEFYSQAAAKVENQNLRNQFFRMARLCAEIADSLSDQITPSAAAKISSGAHQTKTEFLNNSLLNCYCQAPKKHSNFESRDFIEQVEAAERAYLSSLKKQIISIRNKPNARLLSAKVASMQIAHDQLKKLKRNFH